MMQEFECVWDAIAETPEEAMNLRLRSELLSAINQRISGLKQAQAAALLGVEQPRVSEIVRGKLHLFALEKLVKMAARAGLEVQMEVRQPIDAARTRTTSVRRSNQKRKSNQVAAAQ